MLELERGEGLVDDPHVLVQVRVRDVGDVHEKVSVGELLERCAERGDERRRQLVHEPDRIREQDRRAAGQGPTARRGVERRERLIRDENVGPGERIHERRLPGIRVTDDRRQEKPFARARAARPLALSRDLVQLLAKILDSLADDLPVALELRFARATCADAAAESRHLLPAPGKAWKPVLELRELALETTLT